MDAELERVALLAAPRPRASHGDREGNDGGGGSESAAADLAVLVGDFGPT